MTNEKLIYKTIRPSWHYIIAFIFYAIVVLVFIKSISLLIERRGILSMKFFTATMFFLFCAIGLSFIKKVSVDTNKNVRIRFTLFNIKIVSDFIFKEIKYISVFSDMSNKDFTVFFWLSETNKKNIVTLFNKEEALNFAVLISERINVKVLDATEKGNFKWIDKTKS